MVKCLVTFICAQIGHKRTNPSLLFLTQIFFVIKSQKIKMAWFWFLGGLLFATRLYSTMLKENWNVERFKWNSGTKFLKKKNQNNKDFAQVFNPSKIKIGQNRVYKNKNKDRKLVGKRNRLFFFVWRCVSRLQGISSLLKNLVLFLSFLFLCSTSYITLLDCLRLFKVVRMI